MRRFSSAIRSLSLLVMLTMLFQSICLPSITQAASFSDVRSPALTEAVEYLAQKGIIQGYADGTFKPEQTINRAEALKIIFETLGVSSTAQVSGKPFPDVDTNQWFAPYVSEAKQKKLIQGYADGTYKPNQSVNRVEFVKIAMSALPYFKEVSDSQALKQQYSDLDSNGWYLPYLAFAQRFSFLDKATRFKPGNDMSRGDAALIVYRILKFHEALSCESDECVGNDEDQDSPLANLVEEFNIQVTPSPNPNTARKANGILSKIINDRGLDKKGFSLSILSQDTENFDGTEVTFTKAQINYKGIPVFGGQITLEWEGDGLDPYADGELYEFISISNTTPTLSQAEALSIAEDNHSAKNSYHITAATPQNESISLIIYPDLETKQAILAYEISFSISVSKLGIIREPRIDYSPHYLMNANTGEIILEWDDNQTAKAQGPGGNLKIGEYEYGTDMPDLIVRKTRNNICKLDTLVLKTVDALQLGLDDRLKSPHEFECSRNEVRNVNNAFAPMNDAHHYATETKNMFEKWFKKRPIGFRKIILMVHYREDPESSYANAKWSPRYGVFAFGDGDQRNFYPFASDKSVVAHELGHGFTHFNSGLIYAGMSGGMNEAYSDMTGQALTYYLSGTNNWIHGEAAGKNNRYYRYFDDPTQDGNSIDNKSDFELNPSIDVHYSSGVYNKAFYNLATSDRWNTEKAFKTMTRANQYYWTRNSTFDEGACGVMKAARRLHYKMDDVKNAFAEVGVACPPRKPLLGIIIDELSSTNSNNSFSVTRTDGDYESGTPNVYAVVISEAESFSRRYIFEVRGEFMPKNLEIRTEDCEEFGIRYGSSDRFEAVCLMKKNPRLTVEIVAPDLGKTLRTYSTKIYEVYEITAQRSNESPLKATLVITGANLDSRQIQIQANECNKLTEQGAPQSGKRSFECDLVGSADAPPAAIQMEIKRVERPGFESLLFEELVIIQE